MMLCLDVMVPNGSWYTEKGIGPRMERWGTPQVEGEFDEEVANHDRKIPLSQVRLKLITAP